MTRLPPLSELPYTLGCRRAYASKAFRMLVGEAPAARSTRDAMPLSSSSSASARCSTSATRWLSRWHVGGMRCSALTPASVHFSGSRSSAGLLFTDAILAARERRAAPRSRSAATEAAGTAMAGVRCCCTGRGASGGRTTKVGVVGK
jgi:hypothetical protein